MTIHYEFLTPWICLSCLQFVTIRMKTIDVHTFDFITRYWLFQYYNRHRAAKNNCCSEKSKSFIVFNYTYFTRKRVEKKIPNIFSKLIYIRRSNRNPKLIRYIMRMRVWTQQKSIGLCQEKIIWLLKDHFLEIIIHNHIHNDDGHFSERKKMTVSWFSFYTDSCLRCTFSLFLAKTKSQLKP